QMARLDRRRPQQAILYLEGAAVIVEPLALPGEAQDIERLFESRCASGIRPAEHLELSRPIALPQPDLDAAARQIVDHREILGETQRMAGERRKRDRLADPAVRCGHRQRRTGDHRRRTITIRFAVMLAGPDRMETEPVRLGRKLDPLAI